MKVARLGGAAEVRLREETSCRVTLCPAGVQAETGEGDAGKEGAQVPHPEPPRPLAPAQRHRGSGAAALGRRPLLH